MVRSWRRYDETKRTRSRELLGIKAFVILNIQIAFGMIVACQGCGEDVMIQVGRNERCPCGSGKKYKRCCLVPLVETNPDVDDFLIFGGGGLHFLEKGKFEEIVASVREYPESHGRTLKVGPTRTHVDRANTRYTS